MNARLQVEHGVTELVSGLDLVREQFWLAAGRPLSEEALAAAAAAAQPRSHAIQVRISAEDPARDFSPTPGRIRTWRMPSGPGVRVDTAIEPGDRVPPEYDPMIGKLMVVAGDRPAALARLRRALDEVEISGLQTTIPFARAVVRSEAFATGRLSTDFVGEHWDGPADRAAALRIAQQAVAEAADGGGGGPARAVGPESGDESDPRSAGWGADARRAAVDRWPA